MEIKKAAKWFLSKEPMTHRKLQSLLYYSYCTHLVFHETKLFSEKFQGWSTGPIALSIFDEFKDYRNSKIPQGEAPEVKVSKDELRVLGYVWRVYGRFEDKDLRKLISGDDPWRISREGLNPIENGNRTITDKDIYNYYAAP